MTHVQLQPIFDFATVDEVSGEDYNWGYDPLNYNLPEGSYATDAFHGEVRVRECRAMVQALHSAGLGVVMDVVYNHTYYSYSWLERTVPGYWNRRWENGSLTNGSGCGCDLASERTMVRKYLVDSCVYWAKEYHIDGFRFDLMALHDVETMNAIRAALDALPGGEDILMYGEPWQGGSTRMEHGAIPANKQAAGLLDSRIGFFCDNTRDAIKGGVFNAGSAGYINGDMHCGYQVLHSIPAWRGGQADFMPQAPGQVVQYVSAHDNYTLWDKLKCVARRGDYAAPDADLLAQNRMAAGYLPDLPGSAVHAGRRRVCPHQAWRPQHLPRSAGAEPPGLDARRPAGGAGAVLSRTVGNPQGVSGAFRYGGGCRTLHSVPAGVADRLCARATGRKPARAAGRLL